MDSGIKIEATLLEELQTFKEANKYIYDYLIMTIQPIPGAPQPKGNKSGPEHVAIEKKVDKGECIKQYEGQDLGEVDPVHQSLYDLLKDEYENKPCIIVLYFKYTSKSGLQRNTFIAINWVPDTAPMSLKMRYSSTFKTVLLKAPKLQGKVECHDIDDMKFANVVDQVDQK